MLVTSGQGMAVKMRPQCSDLYVSTQMDAEVDDCMIINQNWWRPVLRPGRCLLCGDALPWRQDFCPECLPLLPRTVHRCPRCGAPGDALHSHPCGRCLRYPPAFSRSRVWLDYATPVDRLVQDLKYNGKLHLARALGEAWGEDLAASYQGDIDLLVPVPLHPQRLRQRGFNQALELARPLSRILNIKISSRELVRTRATAPQAELSHQLRYANVRNAFSSKSEVFQGQCVALVDDVMTTGSTASAAATALRQAGAATAEVWILARA